MGCREICRMAMAAVLGATLAAGDATAQVAGFTPGEFSVDPTGAATYRIPLKVPPGTAGMQPELALLYHSRASNGQLGVGWSVSGLSTINRCAAMRDSEGVPHAGGVTLSSSDRFCLDGQPLRHQSGSYGADGTLYLTEIQSFQEVRSYGTTSGAPTRFVVTDRAGLTRHYGQTADSRITSVGGISGRPVGWAINRIEDKHGNFITFSYGRDATHGEYWPTEIRWSNRNAQPLGRVLFSYTSTRPDQAYGHAYGLTKRSLLRRLAHVQVYEGSSAAVRRYVLSYQQGTINNLSYLASVQECAGTGAPCLPATTFTWQHGEQGFVTAAVPKVANHASNIKWLDVNGDGRLDAVLRSSGSIRIYFADRGGTAVTSSVPAGSHLKFDDAVILDYNADGRMDLLVANANSGQWDVYLSHGTGLSYVQSGRPHYGAHTRYPVAFDISGNGVPELFFKRFGKLYVYRGADTGGFLATPVATGWTVSDGQKLMPLEFDGDGLPELFVTFDDCTFSSGDGGGGGGGGGTDPPMDRYGLPAPEGETLAGSAGTDSSSGSTCADSSGPLKWDPASNALHRPWATPGHRHHRKPVPLDIDGDGLADIVSVDPYTSKLIVALNRGGHWENIWTGLNDTGWAKAVVLDWNLDGRDDLLVRGSNGQFLALNYRNNTIEASATGIGAGSAAYLSGDWNGDGMLDLYYLSSGNWYVRRQLGRNPGQLVRVRDGLDNELAVSYAPVPVGLGGAHAVYRGHEASDAGTSTTRIRDFLGPLQVVESYAADAGIGGAGAARQTIVTRYQYAGAKLNLHGRGFLGFRRLLAHNVNTNIVTENVHFQDFPYTGMVAETVQRMPDTTAVTETPWAIWEDWFAEHCSYPYEAECEGPPPPTVVTVPGPIVSRTTNTVASKALGTTGQGRVRFPHIATSTELSAELSGGTPYRRVMMQYTYDNNGNPTHIVATTDDGAGGDRHTVSSVNSYAHSTSCPSRLIQSIATSSGPDTGGHGPLNRQRTARFAYADPGHCQLTSETSNAGTAAALTRIYSYDAFGNRTSETVTGQGISPARVATTTYDSNGRYPVRVANALGHTHSTTWHQGSGVRLSETDANGLTTSWQYDEFGRETRRTAPRSTQFTTTARAWCGAGGCRHPDAVLRVTRTGSGAGSEQSQRIAEFDRLGRKVAAAERNVQGHLVYTLTFYDAASRPYANSGPFRPALDGGACWTLRRYDPLGRVRDEYAAADASHCTSLAAPAPGAVPAGWSRTGTSYNGLSTTVTDPEGRQRQRIFNVLEWPRFVREHDGTSWLQTEYRYDGHGNVTWVRDPGGAVTTAVFDDAGRKTATADPSMGDWRYAYNAAGELTAETDAKNVTATLSYDALGRIRTRAEPDGTTTWTYDNTAHGPARGKVTSIAGPHGYQERFWYNTAGGELRISARYIGDQWFWTHFDHDALGQLLQIRYPSVNCAAPCSSVPSDAGRLRVDRYYRHGHLYLVRERKPDGTTGSRYWEALEVDAAGNVTREKLGNSLFTQRYVNPATGRVETLVTGTSTNPTSVQDLAMDWDRVGNLVQRVDQRANRREDLAYDGLGRLHGVARKTAAGSTIAAESIQYSPAGNILSKGPYAGFQYSSGRPHAVASVSTPAGTRSYSYDANGNLAAVAGPGARTISWWSYHKPRRIVRDGNNHAEYWYGPGGDRPIYRQSARIDGRLELTLYGSVLYERRIVGTVVEHSHYVQANGSTVAVVRRNGTSTVNATRYLHRDHLGSVAALSDESGNAGEILAYDAWGKRRPASTWQTPAPGAFITAAWLRRGYTAHEHIDQVGLIHMGGRLYDPEIGRFLSPDPFVQFPGSTQGFNRYAYVGNNPLSFTDPSGYFLKDLIKTGLTIAAGYYSGGWAAGALNSAAAGAAVGGAVGGYLNTGSLNGATWGAVGGITAYGIGATLGHNIGYEQPGALLGKSLLHGASQGLVSRAGGGRFGDGALGAFAGSMGGPIVGKAGQGARQAMTVAAVGGTAALIGGGKFANGVISGAWVNLFNDQFGIGREPMKNPLRMLWEGFRMRFGGFEPEMAEMPGLYDHLENASRQAQNGAAGVMEAMEGLSLEAGVCAGAGAAVCVSASVSKPGITHYIGYGRGFGLRPYVGISYSPIQHHGIVSITYVGSSHIHAQLIVSQSGMSVAGLVGVTLAPFAGATVGYARTNPWHSLLPSGQK